MTNDVVYRLVSLANYTTLGRSGLRVSPLCLGTMTFGDQWGFGADESTSTQLLETYLDRGGNFLDTANIYTKGYSEAFIGDYFAKKAGQPSNTPRDRVVIATKFMGNMYRDDPNGGGGGRKSIIAACEQSLRRLKTDYIDLYWAHFWDETTPIEETVRAMDDLVRDGKVRYLGISDHPAWVCTHAQHLLKEMKGNPIIALQIEYSLAQRTVEAELVPMARELGMGITPWSPLRGGILTGKFTRDSKPDEETRVQDESPHLTPKNFDIIDELIAIAEDLNASPAQVALRWLSDQPGVTSTIIGARKPAQLEDNLKCLEIALSPEQSKRLDEVSQVTHPFPHEFLDTIKTVIRNGTSVNGIKREHWPLSPEGDDDRY